MQFFNTNLTPDLQEVADTLAELSRGCGLDFFTTVFEMVDYKQLNEIAAYGGFPTRYPHWRWGMEYERLSKSYTYGLSIIYEMVINNDPCYAYLLRANNVVDQKTVIAHVYGHSDFFKNNYWFSKTNRKMLDKMADHASTVRYIIEELGQEVVENFIDVCLSLENLIDIHAPFQAAHSLEKDQNSFLKNVPVHKIKTKAYLDSYVNPKDILQNEKKLREDTQKNKLFPKHPEQDVLGFLVEHAPISQWQKMILSIIREEAYYYAPQGQTKILNEGWATYWHSKMMTQIYRLPSSEIIDYCDHYAGIVAHHPSQLNPYRLGVELLRHIEMRWDTGKFGLDYLNCEDYNKRQSWNKETNLGQKKIFEVRKYHNDITFIDEFLDEDFCHTSKLFLYDYDPRKGHHVISSRDFKQIKKQMLMSLTNFGQPIIKVFDANYKNRGELLLKHEADERDLDHSKATETLKNIFAIWNRPVHIETRIDHVNRRISFDGHQHSIEKI